MLLVPRVVCGGPLGGRALRPADGAWAALAQQCERVVAGAMAVRPGRRDRVVADELDVDHPGLLLGEHRVRVEPARHAGLAAAMGARAKPPQRREVVPGRVTVLPDDVER